MNFAFAIYLVSQNVGSSRDAPIISQQASVLCMGVTYRCMGISYSLGTDKERPFLCINIKYLIIMKKSIFMLVALFAATFANAQITLLRSFEGGINISINGSEFGSSYSKPSYEYMEAPYFYESDQDSNNDGLIVNLYEKTDLSLYKSVHITNIGDCGLAELVSRNIFTTDNKVCFMVMTGDGKLCIYNEDGQLVITLLEDGYGYNSCIVHVNGKYLLIVSKSYGQGSYIYSLPGNGEAQDIETPAVPRKARKVLKKDQILVENADKTYTLQGQEVK